MKFERIHIELTNRCNFSCAFCPDSLMTRPRGSMDFQVLSKSLDEISEERLSKTIFYHVMGEPLLYRDLAKAVRYAKERGLDVCITTNGWLMTPAIVDELKEAQTDHIIFSVQTPDERSFELRRTKVPFVDYRERVCAAIARFLDDGQSRTKISLSFLTTPFKRIFQPNSKMSIVDSKKDLIERATDWIGRIIGGDLPDDVLRRIKKTNILGWNQVEIGDNFYLETRMLGDWVQPVLMSDKIKRARYGMCEGLRGHFGILWNGDLVFCCIDFDANTVFGNVKSTSIGDALRKKHVRETVRQFERCRIIHPYCQKCLGDVLWRRSIVRQIGSILYHKVYRKYWTWKRTRGG